MGLALVAAGLLAFASGARADLEALRQVVSEACGCAAAQASGMDAAVRCTEGPRAFGSMKVNARSAWNPAERAEAATLERIIETCIANALDLATARRRLGLAPLPGPPGAAPMVWIQIRVADLDAHPARLARIHTSANTPLKGMVEAVTDDMVILRQARRDGGGSTPIPLTDIREAWVMQLP